MLQSRMSSFRTIAMRVVLLQPLAFFSCDGSCLFHVEKAVKIRKFMVIGALVTSLQCTATEECIEASGLTKVV